MIDDRPAPPGPSPHPAGRPDGSAPVDGADCVVVALPWLLGALALLAAAQTVLTGSVRDDGANSAHVFGALTLATALPIVLGLAATLALFGCAAAAALGRLSSPSVAAALLVAAAAAGLDSAVGDSPAAAGMILLILLIAGLLTPTWLLAVVGAGALATWAAAATDVYLRHTTAGAATATPAQAAAWSGATALVLAGALASLGLHRLVATVGADVKATRDGALAAAVRDPLTGAVNRRGLDLVAQPMIEQARRAGQAVHCLFLDVDGFSTVNLVAGRPAGDEVLICVAEALISAVRVTDVVARWAGDQFVVIGPGTGSSPLELERRIRAQLAIVPVVAQDVWSGRVSIGSATLVPWDDGDLESLLHRGDQDMNLRRSLRRQGEQRSGADPGTLRARPIPRRTER